MEYIFRENGLAMNPYKGCEILFLPKDILHELPIAKCWDDIDRVVSENENIRREINEAVGEEWSRWYARDKKAYLKEHIFKDPGKCSRVIEGYRKSEVAKYDLNNDVEYFAATLIKTMKREGINFAVEGAREKDSFSAALDVLNIFRNWVEYNKGWDTIQGTESSKREKIVQRLIHLGSKNYISANDLDISFEPDAGRGPVDFKVNRGGDKTIVEIKLSTNTQYLNVIQSFQVTIGLKEKLREVQMARHKSEKLPQKDKMEKIKMYEELTDILRELPQGEYGHWIMDHKNDGSPEHPIQMPFVSYSGLVRKFMDVVFSFAKNHPEHGLNQYRDILEQNGIEWGVPPWMPWMFRTRMGYVSWLSCWVRSGRKGSVMGRCLFFSKKEVYRGGWSA